MKKKPKNLNDIARYSGLAFEMMVPIALGVYGGIKLDELVDKSPLFTVILSLAGVAISMYYVIKSISKIN